MWTWLYKLASPRSFYRFVTVVHPWVVVAGVLSAVYGLLGALYLSPADYQQGDAVRIMYIHVPSASCSLMVYGIMSFAALLSLCGGLN